MGMYQVEKRDGRLVAYNPNKIETALFKAAKGTINQRINNGELDKSVNVEEKRIDLAYNVSVMIHKRLKEKQKRDKFQTINVEDIQNLIEDELMSNGHFEVARNYIKYRYQHEKIRNLDKKFEEAIHMVDDYIQLEDWKVKENSNMGYSLQGLNNHISSEITKQYWLNEVYPEEIREVHEDGSLHIHDLSLLSVYCCGWDLRDLLLKGFSGVDYKVESSAPSHFQTALMQIVNFIFTLQGEASGAQAFSNFDTYLAPFVRHDKLSYKEVYDSMEQFIYNMNISTRVGFQCLSEDTEVLTSNGWRKHNQVKVGDSIKTFNIEREVIEDSEVLKMFSKEHEGKMYNLKNKTQDQLISPNHRVLRKEFNSDEYILEPIEKVLKLKSDPIIPISANNNNPEVKLSDKQIIMIANEVKKHLIEIPKHVLNMSCRQSKVFIDNCTSKEDEIYLNSKPSTDRLQQIIVNSGFGFTASTIDEGLFIIKVIKNEKETYINSIKEVEYKGIIWCPTTENETVVARRNGKVFITGNCPFSNLTMDLTVPNMMKDEPIVLGGEYIQESTYKEYQKEMDMINKAFAEIMSKGDKKGRVFSFPIPTYNITKDFDWDKEDLEPIWEMTRKFGIPYFSNFINSDMSPEDARSFCPLSGSEKVLVKSTRGRGLEYSSIKNIYEGNSNNDKDREIYSDGRFVKGKFNKWEDQELIEVTLKNNHKLKITKSHLNYVIKNKLGEEKELTGGELREGYYLPYSLNEHQGNGGNYDLGYFVGAFAGDGSLIGDTSVVFSLSQEKKENIIVRLKEITNDYFGAETTITKNDDTKLITLTVHSKAAVGLCNDFVGNKGIDKHYNAKLFGMSKSFRNGLLDGHFDTDGGNGNRIYTSSRRMVESLNMLAATLGTTTNIYEDDRGIEDGSLSENTNYGVLIYKLTKNSYGDVWFKRGDRLWIGIDKIEEIQGSVGYCFEVKDDEPVFTVGTTGILTHNCRLKLDISELRKRGGGLFGSSPKTGSIGVVTLNMVRIGYESRTKDEFIQRVIQLMDLAKDSLEIKRKVLEKLIEQGLFPYSKFYLQEIKERFGSYWKNHFATIGLLGMNESLINFMNSNLLEKEGRDFGLKVMNIMRDKLIEYQEDTGNIYNLEATPGEGTTYRFANKDKELFGDKIICANQEDVASDEAIPYYTNSSHLPVGSTDDIFTAIELQDDFQVLYTGGSVLHGFLGEALPTTDVTKQIVKRSFENFNLPYLSITPTFSVCPSHGYLPGEHEYCPKCDASIRDTAISCCDEN